MQNKVKFRGETYKPSVLLVTSRDQYGRPATGRFVHEEQTLDLKELGADKQAPEIIIVLTCRETWGAPEKS